MTYTNDIWGIYLAFLVTYFIFIFLYPPLLSFFVFGIPVVLFGAYALTLQFKEDLRKEREGK